MLQKKPLGERLQDYVNQLKTYHSSSLEEKFVSSLIEVFRNNKLNYTQRADRAIKVINSALFIPNKFSDKLRIMLTQLKKNLIRDVHPFLVVLPKGKNEDFISWATYKNLCSIPEGNTIQAGDYYSKRNWMQNWIIFNLTYDALTTYPYKISDDEYGWKLHISFDHTNPENVEKGMNIVLQHLVGEHVSNFKIIPSDKEMRDEIVGKDVTIYLSDNRPNEEWQKLLSAIETDLIKAGVTPGKQAGYTEPIAQSQFISYRNDKGLNGDYIQNAFNAANEPDTLKDIIISTNTPKETPTNRRSFR